MDKSRMNGGGINHNDSKLSIGRKVNTPQLNSTQQWEQRARDIKRKIAFLRRLELDGKQVKIHQNEREILSLFSNQNEETAMDDLDKAIKKDLGLMGEDEKKKKVNQT